MLVSLILPCYNPPQGWEQTVCSGYLALSERVKQPIELIIVMDGTSSAVTDASMAFLAQCIPDIKLVQYTENRGKGYAIRQGVAAAEGAIILYTDIDFPYTPESMFTIYEALRKGECDVAAGVKNDAYYSHVPVLRRMISRYLQVLIRVLLSMPVTDTQCGLKGFRKNVSPLFLETTIDRYLFDLEFIRNCFKSKKFQVRAIPVALRENVQFRSMNFRILLPEMTNFIRLLLK